VNDLKSEGNKALESGDFEEAIRKYTEAIAIDPKCAVNFIRHA
jgi:tetratricopeptide (TPR) repeat protein